MSDYFDWNNTFQSLLEELSECEEDSQAGIEIYADIAKLAQDFIQCATTYGKCKYNENFFIVILNLIFFKKGKIIISEGIILILFCIII